MTQRPNKQGVLAFHVLRRGYFNNLGRKKDQNVNDKAKLYMM